MNEKEILQLIGQQTVQIILLQKQLQELLQIKRQEVPNGPAEQS